MGTVVELWTPEYTSCLNQLDEGHIVKKRTHKNGGPSERPSSHRAGRPCASLCLVRLSAVPFRHYGGSTLLRI